MAQMRAVANVEFNLFNGIALKASIINNSDTVVFDLSQATCTGQYFLVPVSVISDDVINAVDFSMKYNNSKITYNSVINYKPVYLTPSANFNSTDSILRFTSYSFVLPIEKNTAIAAVRFNLLNGPITAANFNTVKGFLNGDRCAIKFINAVLPTAAITPSGPTTFITGDSVSLTANAGVGFTYLWSTSVTTQTIKVYSAASYSVTVTNAGGCTANAATSVFVTTPLPVQLIDFNLMEVNDGIQINWTTAAENNNAYFTLEHSSNGMEWQELNKINSLGNSNTLSNYSYLDDKPFEGINYYKLKQTDFNGSYSYLNTKTIYFKSQHSNDFIVTLFPNPTSNYLNITSTKNATAQLFTAQGLAVSTPLILNAKEEKQINVQTLPLGIYIFKIKTDSSLKTVKIVRAL